MRRVICLIFCFVLCLLPRLADGEASSSVSAAPASVHIYDREGRPLRAFLSKKETYSEPVELADVSPSLILAAIAAEDRRFYTHPGIDWRALLRAAWQNIRGGGVVSGASTITQQLVRLRTPRPKTWRGKLAEAWEALKLERRLSKEEILRDYFNALEFGRLTQGVQAASHYYFGVPAAELSVAQSALLAGLIQSPTRLNPLQNPQGALHRRGRVLKAMRKNGFISEDEYARAMEEPLGVSAGVRPFDAPHFARLLYTLAPGEAEIHTFLDKDLQLYAEQAVRNHLDKLTENNVTNAAVVVLDNQTGGVLAYVGSADFYDKEHSGQVDGAAALRQPGSALKPFVYALALQNGLTAASVLSDEDTFFEGGFRPRNYDERFHGGVSVRRALACSYNIPAVKAAEPLGAPRLLHLLHALGFASLKQTPDFYGLGLALGGGEVTLLELAGAYAALARGGMVKPVLFAQEPHLQMQTKPVRALSKEISYIITDILTDNAARADAFGLNSPLHFSFPAAAKTGTSKDYKDNFAIGYTPRLTVAVWAGNFDASSMQKVSGISGAAPIMHDVLAYAAARWPAGEFERPEGVLSAMVCEETGLLAGPNCPRAREEVFAAEHLPKEVCDGTHQISAQKLDFVFPKDGDVFKFDPSLPASGQQLHFRLSAGAQAPCVWILNETVLPGNGVDLWQPLQKGVFDLTASCSGRSASVHFTVL